VTTWLPRVVVVSLFVAAVQLSLVSPFRIAGVTVMVTWLWPAVVGILGGVLPALVAGLVTGLFFDAQVATPLGLLTAVTLIVAGVMGLLGREGVGDFRAAAWWVAPLLGAAVGFVAPLLVAVAGMVVGDFGLWRASLGNTMVVNALAFAVLIRPLGRLGPRLVGDLGDLK
jgi:hypothetical protein